MIWPVLKAFGIAALLGFLAILVVTGRAVVEHGQSREIAVYGSFGHGPSTEQL